jgi:hypothetical protein
MNAYMVWTADNPGVAASIFTAAAARDVNVNVAYGLADGTIGLILVASDDEAGLLAALGDAGLVGTPIEMVLTDLENRPGTGAALFGKIAAAGVNLRFAVPVGMDGDSVQIALGADDPAALRAALGS